MIQDDKSKGDMESAEVIADTLYNKVLTGNSKEVLTNADTPSRPAFSKLATLYLAYQSAGVIYGDIGTSPLYVFSSTFQDVPSREDMLGALSMIIWTLTLVVTIKYVVFVLSADDNGEGGTFALYSLLSRYSNISWDNPNSIRRSGFARYPTLDMNSFHRRFRAYLERSSVLRHIISLLAILGVCMVLADGVLTPAQSVLGAIQGLEIKVPNISQSAVTGISEAILILIFLVQPLGTTKIAVTYAPIVIIWLLLNLSIGIYNLTMYDTKIVQAFSPYWIYYWFKTHGRDGWQMMGGILLSFTGVEALYADMGHFCATSIRISWLCLAYPCLLLAYIGQAAYISADTTGTAWSNPFFASVPTQAFWFSFIMAILACVVASQAMISGCFSILNQAMALSNLPQLKVVHTSTKFHGQIYIPAANWALMIGTVCVAAGFPNTVALGNAYGACVTMVSLITTILLTILTVIVWHWNPVFSLAFLLFFGVIDGAYLSATLLKVPEGAWFTIVVAVILTLVMMVWKLGAMLQWSHEDQLKSETDSKESPVTASTAFNGLMVVFDIAGFDIPTVFQHIRRTFLMEPAVGILCHIRQVNVSNVHPDERVMVFRHSLSPSSTIYRAVLRRGYNDVPNSDIELGSQLTSHVISLLENESGTEGEIQRLKDAQAFQTMYLSSQVNVHAKENAFFMRRILVRCYGWILRNTLNNQQKMYGVPTEKLVQININYEL
ncbi:hypothetical protein EC973_004538 [Apophysomyces ossiformis]|uniref:Potassium transporter n=1 Tax=Apophysomyces ossiformis TaxID=679940 RepID=A0A8H7EPU4_9FUNG|nr:hypothetical protein EC973_004538 [Apophysomyces ossiformis]